MRNYHLAISLVLCVLSALILPSLGLAQTGPQTPQAQIAAILADYPNGGVALSTAIARAVERDPALAAVVAQAAQGADSSQQTAIGSGLADAYDFFAKSSSPSAQTAAQQIWAALSLAPTSTVTAFSTIEGAAFTQTQANGGGPSLSNDRCVSPSSPNGC